MALKDWKRDAFGTWINKKNGHELDIEFGQVGNKPKKWFVFLNDKQITPNDGLTKSAAVKFARNYRRKH